jgi:hypothetical protein
VSASRTALLTVLAGAGIGGAVFGAFVAAPPATAQVRPHAPPQGDARADFSKRIEGFLPPGVESRSAAMERVAAYKPDPATYPVPRTAWDGKPDFSGAYWAGTDITRPAVPLESLYRPEARAYREQGGGGALNWRMVDSPAYRCWPPSPAIGSMSQVIQLVSAPGYLVLINEHGGNFRIVPIASEPDGPPSGSRRPSFQGASVGHWAGDTLVIEVTNFNGNPWLGGAQPPLRPPQTSSDALRIVERWSRPDGRTLEFQAVIEDPKMLTGAWTGPVHRRELLPYDMIGESLCVYDPELHARHREYAAAEAAKKRVR